MFSKAEIKRLFQPYVLVQLYTDTVPNEFYAADLRNQLGNDTGRQKEDAAANFWFQQTVFNTTQLPLYVILEPLENTIRVAGVYDEGRINNEAAFAEFLRKPNSPGGSGARAQLGGKKATN